MSDASESLGTYRYEGIAPPWSRPRDVAILVYHLARRQVAQRYQGSSIGFLWTLFNPLLMMIVYVFLFRYVFRAEVPNVPYPCYFLVGYLMWNALSMSVMHNVNVVIECKPLLDCHNFPAWTLPVSRVAAAWFNYLVTLPIVLVFNAVFGVMPGWEILWLPLVLVVAFAMSVGLGLLTAATTPFFRDLQQFIDILLTVGYFLTPIIYPYSFAEANLPGVGLQLYSLNPLTGIVELMHYAYLGMPARVVPFASAIVFSFAVMVIGKAYFDSRRRYFHYVA